MPYCSECDKDCTVSNKDFGIGGYEFWGDKGVDVRMATVSDCCEAEAFDSREENDEFNPNLPVTEKNPQYRYCGEPVEIEDFEPDYDDRDDRDFRDDYDPDLYCGGFMD
jgi:hypothetical protein